ncbi:chymotrypsin-like protease CTRL-1 [Paramacrobiotus metropolitanus]|uniref:chymotrypsin-like protease CTRL-1 n=1 Tax=Paramacrobiotus metropolitanus TaxID=2943436 RepID=UPI002445D84F|nr:chymotrypsin-like protease CTRL-1 [Paramacrobiotus metropolitanus]XP_055345202.1 chymotrypsin-like protease CTRL-1 [Paramacrobiotus metropolitanus]
MPDLKSVITAAHCVHDEKSGRRIPVRELSIAVGIRRLVNVPPSNVITVREAVVHPDYHHKKILNDITILRLATTAAGILGVSSVKLPPANAEPAPGTTLHTAGWGRTQEGEASAASEQLLKTTLKVVDRERCRRSLGATRRSHIPPSQICTENQASGTCNGDSGGPLVNRRSGGDYLVGLTSYGLRGCTLNTADVFTKVSHFTEWIQRVTNGDTPSHTQPIPAPAHPANPESPPGDFREDNPTPAPGPSNGVLQPGGCGGAGTRGCDATRLLPNYNCRTVGATLWCKTKHGELPCTVSGNRPICRLRSGIPSPGGARRPQGANVRHCYSQGHKTHCTIRSSSG